MDLLICGIREIFFCYFFFNSRTNPGHGPGAQTVAKQRTRGTEAFLVLLLLLVLVLSLLSDALSVTQNPRAAPDHSPGASGARALHSAVNGKSVSG